MKQTTHAKKKSDFNPHAFLATIGKGRDMASFQKKNTIFAQGDSTVFRRVADNLIEPM
jgi:hypothetical protein